MVNKKTRDERGEVAEKMIRLATAYHRRLAEMAKKHHRSITGELLHALDVYFSTETEPDRSRANGP